jgi:DNA-directed RNA polymerase subunit RPC12/RpoP
MVAKYKCEECGKKWKSKNSSGFAKQCPSCMGPYIEPYKRKPLDKEKVRQYSVGIPLYALGNEIECSKFSDQGMFSVTAHSSDRTRGS